MAQPSLQKCATVDAFDPDIAGVGIVVSFTVIALTAICLVLYGYFKNELPGNHHTLIDQVLLRSFRDVPHLNHRDQLTTKIARKKTKTSQRIESILNGLSDPQLVSSLAILIATASKWNEISLYSLLMVQVMATTSLLTHFAILRYHPRNQRLHKTSLLRNFAIFVVVCGVLTLQTITQIANCVDPSRDDYWTLKPSCIISEKICTPADSGLTIQTLWIVVFLVFYVDILEKHYSESGERHSSGFLYRFILKLVNKAPGKFDNFRDLYSMRRQQISSIRHLWLKAILEGLSEVEAAYFAIKSSQSADLSWLLAILSYSMTQTYSVWLHSTSPFWTYNKDPKAFGFGQITALVLLLPPILAGLEVPQETHDENTTPSLAMSTLEDPRSDINALLLSKRFHWALIFMCTWNVAAVAYAGIVAGGPWELSGLRYSVLGVVCSLFAWEILFETWDLLTKLIKWISSKI